MAKTKHALSKESILKPAFMPSSNSNRLVPIPPPKNYTIYEENKDEPVKADDTDKSIDNSEKSSM